MNTEDQRRAAEALKDLIVERKRSRWPLVLGLLAALSVAGGAVYWFYLPTDQRPALGDVCARLGSRLQSILNAPVVSPSSPPPSSSPNASSAPPPPSDTGLLSK